jgi:hypothetical protein
VVGQCQATTGRCFVGESGRAPSGDSPSIKSIAAKPLCSRTKWKLAAFRQLRGPDGYKR